jgi:hypothetical protein
MSNCKLERPLNANITRLPESSTPAWNKLENNPRILCSHPVSKLLRAVDLPCIKLQQAFLLFIDTKIYYLLLPVWDEDLFDP